jgi:hypothetical protein
MVQPTQKQRDEPTIERETDNQIIDPNKQQCAAVLGRKGKGKSYLIESLSARLHQLGQTIFDMYASDNLENAFYCVDSNDAKIRIPITILAPDSVTYSQYAMNSYNGRLRSKKEMRKLGYLELNDEYRQAELKPKSQQGKEWVRVVTLPPATKPKKGQRGESENNKKIVDIFIQALLDCRKQRRILVFNPLMFPDEGMMYRTLEVIIRCLRDVRRKHFVKPTEEAVGLPKEKWTRGIKKCWNKMNLVIRELGELCPAKLKGDKTGASTLVKKAMLQFMRKARHYVINCIADWQNWSDVDAGVRSQFDVFILKKWTKNLSGEMWKWAFDYINEKRLAILEPMHYTPKAFREANAKWPPIDLLNPRFMYNAVGDHLYLWPVPPMLTHHKGAEEDFDVYTGIVFDHDESLVASVESGNADIGISDKDKTLFVSKVKEWKLKKRKREWMLQEFGKMQDKGTIAWDVSLKDMKPNTFSKRFTALAKTHSELDSD